MIPETGATLPGDMGSIHIAEALKRVTSRAGGKPTVIARGPEPWSPGFLGQITNWPPISLLQSLIPSAILPNLILIILRSLPGFDYR